MSRCLVLVSAASAARAAPYVAALAAAGLAPESIRVVTADPDEAPAGAAGEIAQIANLAELAGGATGLVLCGGEDVDPRLYGEEPLPAANVEVAPRRDALEWELLEAARARRVPVWGICRGFQVLNVFFGGSLWQDLPLQRPEDSESTAARDAPKAAETTETPETPKIVAHDPGPPNDRLAHAIRVLAPRAPLGERLAAAGPAPRVNSRHHQGVRRLGAGLLAVAAAPDGLIEAAILSEDAGGRVVDGWWVRGVEWHPENLLALPEQVALWRDFTAAVARP